MNLVIFVGGTGQMVLHHYAQLSLVNATLRGLPLRALVIDQDDVLPSITLVKELFEALPRTDAGHLVLGGDAPWVRLSRLEVAGEKRLLELFGGLQDNPYHPARAFVDNGSLQQTVQAGLFARPALGSLLWGPAGGKVRQDIEQALAAVQTVQHPTQVTLVCSVVGGTGGGLVLPILRYLRQLEVARVSVVLFGRYFSADSVKPESQRMHEENERSLLRSLLQHEPDLPLLRLRCLLGGNIKVDGGKQEKARNLSWPIEPQNPFGEACYALDQILSDTVTPNGAATPVSVPPDRVEQFWTRSRLRMNEAVGAVETLLKFRGITRLGSDPFARRIWGPGLVDSVVAFWRAQHRGHPDSFENFPALLETALRDFGLKGYAWRDVFPLQSAGETGGFRRLRVVADRLPGMTKSISPSDPTRAGAAHLLYNILRAA